MSAMLLSYGRISGAGTLAWSANGASARQPLLFTGGRPWPAELKARQVFTEPFPKFGRMDPLCKFAVSAAQLAVAARGGLDGLDRDEISQVGATSAGCLSVDSQYLEATIGRGEPGSPALFVYTLPSMFQGEVAIRFGLRGRCTLLSAGRLSAVEALATAVRRIETGRERVVLVIAADDGAAGADPAEEACAAAWLLAEGAGGAGPRLFNASCSAPAADAVQLTPGRFTGGATYVEAIEGALLKPKSCTLAAAENGRFAGFTVVSG